MSQDTSERGYGLKVSLYGMNPVCRKEHGEMVKFHTYENGQQRTCVTPASVANGVAQAFSSINGLDPDIIPCQIMGPAELAIFSYGLKARHPSIRKYCTSLRCARATHAGAESGWSGTGRAGAARRSDTAEAEGR